MRELTKPELKGEERKTNSGFSLIELLIVVAIILIIFAIAIPSLLRSRIAANEAAAAENLRTITTAAVVYNSTWSNGFPPTLAALGGSGSGPATCDAADLIDPILSTAPSHKSGYSFAYTGQGLPATPPPSCPAPGFGGYLITATPINLGMTGERSFCSDTPGIIHFDLAGVTAASPAACDALPGL
jgi:type IV pilus assembly protein PilA